jgi:hypothetical protein
MEARDRSASYDTGTLAVSLIMNRSKEDLTVFNIIHTTTSLVCSWGCVMEVMNSLELSRTPISLGLPPEFHTLTYAWNDWALVGYV